jgi:SAM-dependent methyltransferase
MRGLRAKVRNYYSGTIERHGPTPLGVDWPNAASQYLRFVQLLKLCDFGQPFSLNDLGCGYGALLEYLAMRHADAAITYRGIDLSTAMVAAARERWAGERHAEFAVGAKCGRLADYSISSGTFNVRLGHALPDWENHIEAMLTDLCAASRIGFAANFMLPHDDSPMEDALYRVAPQHWVGFCRQELGCSVSLLKGYGLREFTLLVRKKPRASPPLRSAARRNARRSPR